VDFHLQKQYPDKKEEEITAEMTKAYSYFSLQFGIASAYLLPKISLNRHKRSLDWKDLEVWFDVRKKRTREGGSDCDMDANGRCTDESHQHLISESSTLRFPADVRYGFMFAHINQHINFVTSVTEGSQAARGGVQVGMVLTKFQKEGKTCESINTNCEWKQLEKYFKTFCIFPRIQKVQKPHQKCFILIQNCRSEQHFILAGYLSLKIKFFWIKGIRIKRNLSQSQYLLHSRDTFK